MALGDVIFNAKLNTQPLEREVKKVERMKVKSPFAKFREDFTFFKAGWRASAEQMRAAQKEALGYEKVFEELVEQGKAFKETMDSMIGGPTLSQQEDFQKLSEKIQQAKSDMEEAQSYMKKAERGFNARNLFGKVFGRVKELGSKFLQLGKNLLQIGKNAKGAGNSISHGMGQGIKRMLGMVGAGALLYKAFQMVREGMNNIIAYDKTTANSVNMLKNSFTALKNAMASVVAPILNILAPVLAKLIGMLTSAANAVAGFLSALTGKKFVVQATKVADGFGGIGDSAGGANKSAKELKRTLMGFDKINKLDGNSGGGSGGGGGGGAGGGGGGGFSTVPIDSKLSDLAERFKKEWAKDSPDFYWFGKMVAEKINEALENIPWQKINKTLEKIAKSIGTFLNGFMENLDWKLLARTISEGIATAFNFVSTLLETIKWKNFGKAIVDFIVGIKWKKLFKAGARLAGNILGAISAVFAEVAKRIAKSAKKYFDKHIKEAGGNVVKGLYEGIIQGIRNVRTWIYDNIFRPFLDGFLKAFGIQTSSSVLKEQGKKLIEGLLEGLKEKFKSVVSWVRSIPELLLKEINKLGTLAVNFVVNADSSALKKMVDLWNSVKSKSKKVLTLVASLKGSLTAKVLERIQSAWAKLLKLGKSIKLKLKSSGITSTLANALTKIKSAWSAIKGGTKKITLSFVDKFKGAWSSLKTWLRNNAPRWLLNLVGLSGGGVLKGGGWQSITKAASGGAFNRGQMFVAREKGPELVGTMGGHTAVMNNDQIVASVSSGVAKAIAGVRFRMSAPPLANRGSSAFSGQGDGDVVNILMQILKAINDKDLNVSLDSREIAKSTIGHINSETRRTGMTPLLI